jgi:hypothetical protein
MSRTERITVRVTADQKARLKRYVEEHGHDGMSALLNEQIDALLADDEGSAPEGHYPSDEQLRSLYVACLEIADEFRLVMKRHRSALARESGVAKTDLEDVLAPLRRQGFVARRGLPPSLPSEHADRWTVYDVKPPAANPDEWAKREVQLA